MEKVGDGLALEVCIGVAEVGELGDLGEGHWGGHPGVLVGQLTAGRLEVVLVAEVARLEYVKLSRFCCVRGEMSPTGEVIIEVYIVEESD